MSKQDVVHMMAVCVAREGCADALRRALVAVIVPTRSEHGCLSYVLHADLETTGTFVFYETWEDQAALDRHFEMPHTQNLIAEITHLLARPVELYRLKTIDPPQ